MVVLPRLPLPLPPPTAGAVVADAVAAYEVDDGLLEDRPWPTPPVLLVLLRLLWFAVAVVVVAPWLMTAAVVTESLRF